MDRRTAKELLHIRDWLETAALLVQAGLPAYEADELRQEAGDSLMMKIGEAASRMTRRGISSPKGVEWRHAVDNRNWLIHQYDQIDRAITWATLTRDLSVWRATLAQTFAAAAALLAEELDPDDGG